VGRRRDYEEGYEDARREMMDRETAPPRGGAFTAAVFINYAAIVIVVLVIAYVVVLRIVGAIKGAF
jgi:hypothetical protein